MRDRRASRTVSIVLSVALVSGCAGFPGRELEECSSGPLSHRNVAVDYEVEWLAFGSPNETRERVFSRVVRDALEDSEMFSDVQYGVGKAPYHLFLRMSDTGNRIAAVISGFIAGYSLGVIPGYARDNFELTVELSQDDLVLKTYEYRDHSSAWFHIFMVFAMRTHSIATVGQQVRQNMIWNFLHDFDRDLASESIPALRSPQP